MPRSGPGMEPRSPASQTDSLPSEPPGKPSGGQETEMYFGCFLQDKGFHLKPSYVLWMLQPDIGRNDLRPAHLTASA